MSLTTASLPGSVGALTAFQPTLQLPELNRNAVQRKESEAFENVGDQM